MRIEKISDTQIRVTLSHSDLNPRDIKISELAYGSKKAQQLFRDMMEQAYEEFGFETENVPLMIEAVPLSTESIMIVVTKIEDPSQIDDKLNSFGERPTHRTFKGQDLESDLVDDKHVKPKKTSKPIKESIMIYSFPSLDSVINASQRIISIYCGTNSLYKDDKGTYFLVLYPNFMHKTPQSHLEAILLEFGKQHVSSSLSEHFLMEHADVLIKNKAIEVLVKF